jgi:hypothetical protein
MTSAKMIMITMKVTHENDDDGDDDDSDLQEFNIM